MEQFLGALQIAAPGKEGIPHLAYDCAFPCRACLVILASKLPCTF